MTEPMAKPRAIMRWLMAAFYLVAGIGHVVRPEAFLPIVPDWVPLPRGAILVTGLCELAGAFALLTVRWRRVAGIMLALYALSTSSTRSKASTCRRSPIAGGTTGRGSRFSRC